MANKSKDMTFGSECAGSIDGEELLIVSNSLKAEHEWAEQEDEGMVGTDKPENLGREVKKKDVKGAVTVRPSYAQADILLAACFDETTGTFTPLDAPEDNTIVVVVDRGPVTHTYADCWISELEISGSENEPLDWKLDLLGKDEAASGSAPAPTIADRMWFSDLSISINSNNYFAMGMRFRFNYDLTDRFHMSQTRDSVAARVPKCFIELDVDLNSDTWADLFALAGTDTTVDDVVLTFADGSNTMTITVEEMAVMNASIWGDDDGVEAKTGTLILRAFLENAGTDIVVITYA